MKRTVFFRRLSYAMRFFWIMIVCNAAYILKYTLDFRYTPGEAFARGAMLSAVPAMTEYIWMSTVLLLLCAAAAEYLHGSTGAGDRTR